MCMFACTARESTCECICVHQKRESAYASICMHRKIENAVQKRAMLVIVFVY